MTEYVEFYHQEKYLFKQVSRKFKENGELGIIDFMCILIWKAERAKSKNVRKLIAKHPGKKLDWIARELTRQIHKAESKEEKLRILLEEWEFRLPTASAILTVLYPDQFTVYDYRVCEQIRQYKSLACRKTNSIIKGYFDFVERVKIETPEGLPLRDKDRHLIGKYLFEKLERDYIEP